METSFILIDKNTKQIRTDSPSGCLLIFDNLKQAEKFKSLVKPKVDRDNTEIVERYMTFESITQK